jgi:hypothetical protein
MWCDDRYVSQFASATIRFEAEDCSAAICTALFVDIQLSNSNIEVVTFYQCTSPYVPSETTT